MNGAVQDHPCVVGMDVEGLIVNQEIIRGSVLGQRELFFEDTTTVIEEGEVARKTTASHTRQEGRKCILGTILILLRS